MIFVTIGTQEPFDRMIKAIDELFVNTDEEVVAQVSNTAYEAVNMRTIGFVSPKEFEELFNKARLIISHAGMGTIISALQKNKPIVVMPRKASLGEHRNEHQMATAKQMKRLNYVYVALDENELKVVIKDLTSQVVIQPLHRLGIYASSTLIKAIQNDIENKNDS